MDSKRDTEKCKYSNDMKYHHRSSIHMTPTVFSIFDPFACWCSNPEALRLLGADTNTIFLQRDDINEIGLIEANEAFAAQSIAVARDLKCDVNKINVNGGAIALGHPIGASGARILTTLIYEMKRSNTKKGLATLCIGGGQGTALIVENI